MSLITVAAEAFLQAVEKQTHDRQPSPAVYRTGGTLRDVQIAGQIDILGAMREAIAAMRDSTEDMEEVGSAYVAASSHISVDGIWSAMIDAALAARD